MRIYTSCIETNKWWSGGEDVQSPTSVVALVTVKEQVRIFVKNNPRTSVHSYCTASKSCVVDEVYVPEYFHSGTIKGHGRVGVVKECHISLEYQRHLYTEKCTFSNGHQLFFTYHSITLKR